jgi:hypothetical protein
MSAGNPARTQRQPSGPEAARTSRVGVSAPTYELVENETEVAASAPVYKLVEHETAKGRGYTVVRCADGKLLSWDFLPKEDGIQCLEVVGESYHREDLQQPGFAAGFPIKLVPEPGNQADPDAVAVRDASGKYQAGYLSRHNAPKILKRIKKKTGFQALVMWEINIEGKRVSLRILLMDAGTQIKLTMPDEALSAWKAVK